MPRYFTTLDADGHKITENARIAAFDTEAEAHEYLASAYRAGLDDGETITFDDGDFGDCWLKLADGPEAGQIAPFSAEDVSVLHPGQHPGGDLYWVTPRSSIIVAIVK